MATKTINVDVLAKMFLAGAQNIEAKKDYINELNVFPVYDDYVSGKRSNSIKQTGYERSCKGDFFRISAWCKR